ncbi:MAG TPA: hypothetical protein PK006_09790 [Saprospiraceae bacterium]|nr:hypothetical protein [Saprospiraceae bacterium]
MSLVKILAKETLLYGLSYSLIRVVHFLILTPYLTGVFAQHKAYFPIQTEVYFLIALAVTLLGFRSETLYFRFVGDEKNSSGLLPTLYQGIVFLLIAFCLISFLLINPINQILRYPPMEESLILAVFIIALDVMAALPFAQLRQEQKVKQYAIIKVLSVLITIVCTIVFIELDLHFPLHFYSDGAKKVFLVLAANLIGSLFSFFCLFRKMNFQFKYANSSLRNSLIRYAWPLVLVSLCYLFNQLGSISLVKYFYPAEAMQNLEMSSDFSAVLRLSVIMNIFVTAFNYAAEPFFFKNASRDDHKQLYGKVSLYFVLVCSVLLLGVCLFQEIPALLLNKEFRGNLNLLSVLLLSNIFVGISTNFSTWYKLSDRTMQAAYISIASVIFTLLCSLIWIPKYGVQATAYIMLAGNGLITVISYLQGQKNYAIDYPLVRMGFYLIFPLFLLYLQNLLQRSFQLNSMSLYSLKTVLFLLYLSIIYFIEKPHKK